LVIGRIWLLIRNQPIPLPSQNRSEEDNKADIASDTRGAAASAIPAELTHLASGTTTWWTMALRTINLLEGFLPVPADVRPSYPPAPRGGGRWEVMRGRWFETGEHLWVWLDRERHLLCGPDLADRLGRREAGERYEITWAVDCLDFRPVGVDPKIQREETRLADAETLARLRGGLGESYRQSIVTILADRSDGLTFRELRIELRERQSRDVHRGTVRAILHAGGFVCRDGRWQVGHDDQHSRRLLREAVVRAADDRPPGETQPYSRNSRLLEVASSVADRCRALRLELRGAQKDSTAIR
jgi:hypothetical protein